MKKYLSVILAVSLLLSPEYVKADTSKVKIIELKPKVDTRFQFGASDGGVKFYINYDLNKDGVEDLAIISGGSVVYLGLKKGGYSKDFSVIRGGLPYSVTLTPHQVALKNSFISISSGLGYISDFYRSLGLLALDYGENGNPNIYYDMPVGQNIGPCRPLENYKVRKYYSLNTPFIPENQRETVDFPCDNNLFPVKNFDYTAGVSFVDFSNLLGIQSVEGITPIKLRKTTDPLLFIRGVAKYTNPNIAPEKVYFFYNKKEKIAYKLTGSEMRAFSELNDGTLLYERDGKMFNISLTIKQPVIKPIIWSICSSKSEFKKRKVKGTKCGKDEVKMGSITE